MTTSSATPEPVLPECWVFLPQMRMDTDALVQRARAAEAAGFAGLSLMDHLAPPLAEDQPMLEAMVAAAWVLASTSTLRVGHLVLCDSLRHPAVLAREVVSLDHASGGRFELGLGSGSVPAELERFGVGRLSAKERTGRLGETLEVLAGLWSGAQFSHSGEHFELHDAVQQPVPLGEIPIVLGGSGPRTLDLVARHATWWNLPVHQLDRLDDLAPRVAPARPSVQLMVAFVADGVERAEVEEPARRRFGHMGDGLVVGDATELRAELVALRARGVQRTYLWFADFAPPATLTAFGAEVLGAPG